MAGIGIRLTSAILSDGPDIQRFKFSDFGERADSGMTLRRQAGRGERAISGIPSTAEVQTTAQEVTAAQYEWLLEHLGQPIQLRTINFSAQVTIKTVSRRRVAARSDTIAWNVRLVFFIINRN